MRLNTSMSQFFRPGTYVGLDIGTTTVKATWFRRGRMGHDEIVSMHQSLDGSDEAGGREASLSQALRGLFKQRRLAGVPVVIAMPSHQLYFRMVTLPFTDPKKIAQVIPFETEALIPVGLDDVILDHTIVSATDAGSTVLVAAVPRDRLSHQLETLANAGVDPVVADIDALSLFHFYRYALRDSARDMALIDIGASKSTMCIVGGGELLTIRSIMIAGDTLTRKLMNQSGDDHATAETKKRHLVVSDHVDGSDPNDPVSRVVQDFLQPLVTDICNTIRAQESVSGHTIRHLYVCGGGSKLDGLPAYLAEQLDLDLIDEPHGRFGAAKKHQAAWEKDSSVSLGLASSAALWGQEASINLRQGAFSIPHRERPKAQKRWIQLGCGVAVLLSVMFANFYLEYSAKETKLQTLKAALDQHFRTTFPHISTVVDPIQQGRMEVNQVRQRLAVFGSNDPAVVLIILAELTEHLPEGRTLDVNELTIEGDKIKIDASTDSFESVNAVKAALTSSERLDEVVVSDARMGAKAGQVNFRVTSLLRPK